MSSFLFISCFFFPCMHVCSQCCKKVIDTEWSNKGCGCSPVTYISDSSTTSWHPSFWGFSQCPVWSTRLPVITLIYLINIYPCGPAFASGRAGDTPISILLTCNTIFIYLIFFSVVVRVGCMVGCEMFKYCICVMSSFSVGVDSCDIESVSLGNELYPRLPCWPNEGWSLCRARMSLPS